MPELPTPYVSVDVDVLDRNIARMAAHAAAHGLSLRPHAKTHKTLQIAKRQVGAGATGLTVATVGEAEIFAAAGFTDLFLAYPLWVDAARGARLAALAERGRVAVGADSAESVRALAQHAGAAIEVMVEIDSGHHRSGVAPAEAGTVAAAALRAGLRVRGVFTFPGHGYGPGQPPTAAADEAAALAAAADALRAAGVQPQVVSGGSTPTAPLTGSGVTELRPGVYAFNDAQQVELGVCEPAEVALTVTATVVSRRPGHVILDSGNKVLGADRPAWTTGFGRLVDLPEARIVTVSEHHATVVLPDPADLPPVGTRVRVMPNHVCAAVNLADELVVTSAGQVVDRWRVAARGANS
ncbi:alanine racemase [Catellatospora sp. KI3]|uniref:alanine racemase n=1 Tax=Catellatospora sp. KI3 TaxID=3041620 RepID=UPI0024829B3A|nr:alanine racemase [Catellatospora sp. KI3]MDI1463699.1 alanine racemase [Catellatospora sp. KI3]